MTDQNNPDQTKTKLPWKEVMEKGVIDGGDFSGYGNFHYKSSRDVEKPAEKKEERYQV